MEIKWCLSSNHNHLVCEGAVCGADLTDDWQKNVKWFPGDKECGAKPMTHWQKVTRRINRRVEKGTFKHLNRYFTAEMLNKIHAVTNSTKGKDPDRKTWV